MTRAKRIRWSHASDPTSDLCGKTAEGYWDVVHGVDGWVVRTPSGTTYVHDGTRWVDSQNRRLRGLPQGVTRDQAKAEAERMFAS